MALFRNDTKNKKTMIYIMKKMNTKTIKPIFSLYCNHYFNPVKLVKTTNTHTQS